jgi:hypothetical protein
VLAQLYTLVAFSIVLARAGLNPFAFSEKRAVVTVSG